jgi:hypothetical protein
MASKASTIDGIFWSVQKFSMILHKNSILSLVFAVSELNAKNSA